MKNNNYKMKNLKRTINSLLVCLLLVVLSLTLINSVRAQVASYTFAYSAGTYTPISGIIVDSGTWDDANSGLITIPFTFTYNNVPYTTLGINSNGFIVMGAVNGSQYDVCGLQQSSPNAIAGYGTDLINGTGGNSIVQYTTSGTTPNRQFVVQWNNVQHYGSTTDHWDFQIVLNETSNTVQVVWGTSTDVTNMGPNSCSDANTESGSVGLLGNTTADFNLRSVTTGNNDWTTSAAGGAITSVCNISSSNIPDSGLTYTWTPPVPVPMTYDSSTTVFLHSTQTDPPGSTDIKILQIEVVTNGTLSPIDVTALNLSTTGCTNAGNDIANAKVYFTGTSSTFSNTTQFGSTFNNPNGAYTINGTATLLPGTNYFWVTYNITNGATMGDTLRGCCTQITGSGTMGTQTPTVTCPVGYQTVNPPSGWFPVTTTAPDPNGGVMVLMTDGTVLCKTFSGGNDGYGNIWDKLTPDSTGSYVNGTWSQIAPMFDTRLFFSSQVLADGRLYVAGGEYGSGEGKSEVYDPLTNVWTSCPSTGFNFVDANSQLLPNGHVLQACEWNNVTFDYDPATNTYSNQQNTLGGVDESAWVKLPDSSVLFVNIGATSSERYIPSLGQWIADANVPVALYDPYGFETGPGFMLPNGRLIYFGAPPVTAIYTPSGNQNPGSFVAGPVIPNSQGCPDCGADMMPNGKILIGVSPQPTSQNHFPAPTTYYEFDYLTNSWNQILAPDGNTNLGISSYVNTYLQLPDGSVLFAAQQSGNFSYEYFVYKPKGSPLLAGKPTIGIVNQTSCDSFSVIGKRFNGISEGAAYGDDWQMSTNYPIVRLTHNGNVYYARTYNWNRPGTVQTGSLIDTTYFSLPAGLPHTTYYLVVTANGNPSDSVLFVPFPIFSSTLTPPAICSGTAFTYTPTTYVNNTTYSWTRAAVAGISNAAITIPQNTNPNEVLINTTTNPVSVVYQYILTAHGCTDTQLVTVVVNPAPTPIITPNGNTVFCFGNSVTLDAGVYSSYSWSNSSTGESITVSSSGNYVVTVTGNNGCTGTTSQTVTVNQLPTPSITPNGNTVFCSGNSVTLDAGTYSSYNWSNSSTSESITVSSSGNYIVTVTDNNGCTGTTSQTVTVNALPTPTITPNGNTVFCFGNSVTLDAGIYSSYNWSNSSTGESITVSSSGNYIVTVTDNNGCTGTTSQTITVNPLPTPTITPNGNTAFCFGNSVTLDAGIYSSYNWSNSSTSESITVSSSGNYIVTVTNNNGCTGTTSQTVTVNPLPVVTLNPTDTAVCLSSPAFNLSGGNPMNGTYWGIGVNNGVFDPPISGLGTFVITYAFTDSLGCSDSATQNITVDICAGINGIAEGNFINLYPNPNDGSFMLSYNLSTNSQFNIMDVTGRIVYTHTLNNNSGKVYLNASGLSNGIYYWQVISDKITAGKGKMVIMTKGE